MKLRKCSDISLSYSIYYELVNDDGEVLLDIHKSDGAILNVSIGKNVLPLKEFQELIQQAQVSVNKQE